jgi:nicotinamidase-related amidase
MKHENLEFLSNVSGTFVYQRPIWGRMGIEIADRSAYTTRMNELLAFDRRRAVVLTIDLQREYLDDTVGQAVIDAADVEPVLAANRRLLAAARAVNVPVVHAYVVRSDHEVDSGIYSGGLAYIRSAQHHGVSQSPHRPPRTRPDRLAGSPESQVPAELLEPSDIHITGKKSLDSFAHTELGFLFSRVLKPEFVITTGINTDTCVYSTTFTAANLGYSPIVVRDCVASMRGRDSHEMALELMSRSIAWVVGIDDILRHLQAPGRSDDGVPAIDE